MISIRKKQLKVFEDMTMFEQQILCHKLPNSFNNIKTSINNEESNINACNKIIQDFKRQMLHIKLEQYEIKIQQYEYQFEQEFAAFELETSRTNSLYQISHVNELMHYLKTYLYHNTNLLIRQVRYKESCLHVKLSRQYHRQRLSAQKNIDVYPQIIVDAEKVPLNCIELDYLSRNGKFRILPNNSLD